MALITFPINPNVGVNEEYTGETETLNYANGTQTRTQITPQKRSLSLSWSNVTSLERTLILETLRFSAGVNSFEWIYPGDAEPTRWVASSNFRVTRLAGEYYTITARLIEA